MCNKGKCRIYLKGGSVRLPELDVDGCEDVAGDRGVEIQVPGDEYIRL